MRITSKGQITIPIAIREQYGLLPDTDIEFEISEVGIIVKKSTKHNNRGARVLTHMRRKSTISMTTDEIMSLTRG
jgi:AbrB family looped-hinge helix DNA binding protein